MMKEFHYIKGEGLYTDDLNTKVADFDVVVSRKYELEIYSKNGLKKFIEYELTATILGGEFLSPRRVKQLKRLDFNSLWSEIIDAELDRKARNLLEIRLQQSSVDAQVEKTVIIDEPGIHHVDGVGVVYAFGNQLLTSNPDSKIDVICTENMRQSVWRKRENWVSFQKSIDRNYIDVAPTCSVIVLYSVLLAVVKPFFVAAGYRPTLCVNLFGRSGVGKTRLVRAMGQLTENLESFWGSMLNDRKNEVLSQIEDAYGGVFVLDDFHPTATGHTLDRQLDVMNAVIRKIESIPKSPVVFMTSEMLGGEYSMQDRMLQVYVEKVDNNLMCQIENAPYYLPEQALVFVKKFLENYTQALEDIKQMYQKLNSVNTYSRAERQGEELKMVARLYGKYVDASNYYDELEEALRIQHERQRNHMEKLKERDEEVDYVKLFHNLVYQNGVYKVCSSFDGKYEAHYDEIFLQDGEKIWITKNALLYGIKKLYGTCDNRMCKKIIDALHEYHILLEDTDAKTRKFAGIRHLCVLDKALKSYIELLSE